MENMVEVLEDWRKSRNLTQSEAAEKFGVEGSTYSMWVSRNRLPRKHWPTMQALTESRGNRTIEDLIAALDVDDVYKSLARAIPNMPKGS